MGVVIPEGYGQVNVIWRLNGQNDDVVFTIGVNPGSGSMSDKVGALVEEWEDVTNGCFRPAYFDGYWTWKGAKLTEMTDTGPVVYEYPRSATGSRSGAPLPANCALIVDKRTARGGRKGRGRMFWPNGFVSETEVGRLGEIDSTGMSNLNAQVTRFVAAFGTVDLSPVLLHSDATPPDAITSISPQSLLATQRKRMRR